MVIKKTVVYVLLLCFLLPRQLWGCEFPVTALEKGAPSPCTGFLFSPEAEQKVRLLKIDYDFKVQELQLRIKQLDIYQKETETLNLMLEKQDKKIELWQEAAFKSTERAVAIESRSYTRDVLFFSGGILAAILTSIIIKNTVR